MSFPFYSELNQFNWLSWIGETAVKSYFMIWSSILSCKQHSEFDFKVAIYTISNGSKTIKCEIWAIRTFDSQGRNRVVVIGDFRNERLFLNSSRFLQKKSWGMESQRITSSNKTLRLGIDWFSRGYTRLLGKDVRNWSTLWKTESLWVKRIFTNGSELF